MAERERWLITLLSVTVPAGCLCVTQGSEGSVFEIVGGIPWISFLGLDSWKVCDNARITCRKELLKLGILPVAVGPLHRASSLHFSMLRGLE
jgi:hypothetical protein